MAEFCRRCFIENLRPTPDEIERIVMSGENDLDFCEGCGEYGQYVLYLSEG